VLGVLAEAMGAAIVHHVTILDVVVVNRRRCCGGCMGSMESGGLSSGLAVVLGVRDDEMFLEGIQGGSGGVLIAPRHDLVVIHGSLLECIESCFDGCGIADGVTLIFAGKVLGVLDAAPQVLDVVLGVPWFVKSRAIGFQIGCSDSAVGGEEMSEQGGTFYIRISHFLVRKDGVVAAMDGGKQLLLEFLLHGDALFVEVDVSLILTDRLGDGRNASNASGRRGSRVDWMDESCSMWACVELGGRHDEEEMAIRASSKGGGDGTSIGIELLAEELESGIGGLVHDRGEYWVGDSQRRCRHGEFWGFREDRW